jgi:Uma2 family endonuclease
MNKSRPYIANMVTRDAMTAEELYRLSLPNKRTELVAGRLIVREPPGFRHGRVAAGLAAKVWKFVEERHLGVVLTCDPGFILQRGPDTVRAPDIAFISRERLPYPEPVAYAEVAPDLAIEVLSPGDRPDETLAKVADWLNAGTRLVWLVDPGRRQVRVYREDGTEVLLSDTDRLDGEEVVPGFSIEVADIL